MSRRSRAGGAVRGPSSALTSFLAGLGVEPSHRINTWGDRSAVETPNSNGSHQHHDPANVVTDENVEAGPSRVGQGTPSLDEEGDLPVGFKRGRGTDSGGDYQTKRARAASIDSDDLDADDTPVVDHNVRTPNLVPQSSTNVSAGPMRPIGEFMVCGECVKRFTVTAYTKEHPTNAQTYLCVQCCYALGIDPFAKPKKAAQKKAVKKQDRAKIVHYEQRRGVNSLGDICIQLVGKYIENVEQLGDIGSINMDKVCRIICKGRRLTPETAPLFYSVERDSLDMYDCTRLTPEAFLTLANLCPNLQALRLDLVGQMSTEVVSHWAKTLKQLKRIELHAPFLVRKEAWIELFRAAGARLEGFLVTQSPRIDKETVHELVKNCPNLTELRLSEIGKLDSGMLEELKPLERLRLLDISSPPDSLTDDAIINLLEAVGDSIEELNLADNFDLTDAILPAIVKYCPRLQSLCLRNLTELTDQGVTAFFGSLQAKGHQGLRCIDMEKGHELSDSALGALIAHSGETIEWLSLLGWREVALEALNALVKCKNLKYLDVGWCRAVNNFWVKDVLDGCNAIEQVRVWGTLSAFLFLRITVSDEKVRMQ